MMRGRALQWFSREPRKPLVNNTFLERTQPRLSIGQLVIGREGGMDVVQFEKKLKLSGRLPEVELIYDAFDLQKK